MDFSITSDDITKFLQKKASPENKDVSTMSPKLALSKQSTVQNAIMARQQGKPQQASAGPTADGFGRTV